VIARDVRLVETENNIIPFALYSHPRLVVMKPQCMLTGDLADKPTRGMPTPGQTNSRKIQVTDNPVGEQLC